MPAFVDTSSLDLEVFGMANKTARHRPEFKRQMVELSTRARPDLALTARIAVITARTNVRLADPKASRAVDLVDRRFYAERGSHGSRI